MAKLNRFDAAATSAQEVAQAIADDGYAIISGALDAIGLAALRGELDPLIEATPCGHEDFMGKHTKRFGCLMARCPKSHDMALDPLVLGVVEAVLGPYCANVQINYTGVMHLEPGEKAQVLHRDASLYPFQNPAPPTICATMWAVSDFTKENGATCLVPGSHRWEDARDPTPDEIVMAEMPAGSVLIYNGSTIHAGGANRSNGARTGAAIQFALGWLRQEENQYLAMPIEQARTLPKRLQELMGYDLGTVNLGFVDHKHPNDILNGTAGEGPGDLGPQALMDKDNAILRMKVSDYRAVGRRRFSVEAE